MSLDGFTGSGADWLERFKPYIEDGQTILGGMLANMCVKAHLRDLLEQGFEVVVARDATAAPRHPEWSYGYTAALINFRFLAHGVPSTDEVVKAME